MDLGFVVLIYLYAACHHHGLFILFTPQQRSFERKMCHNKKMIVRVLALVFLFLLKLRFPANKSVAEIICKRYGVDAVKRLRKFEKLDFKIRKNEADLEFLQMCHQDGLTPKFLNFKLANSSLKHSKTCKQYQLMLLKEEIKMKRSIISKQKKKNLRLFETVSKRLYHCLILQICLVCFSLVMIVNW